MRQCYVWDYEDQFAKACEKLPGMAIAHSAIPVHNRAKGGCPCDRCKFYREFVLEGGWVREFERNKLQCQARGCDGCIVCKEGEE